MQFRTDETQYYGANFWAVYGATNQALMSTVTATVKKESGSLTRGYGIVFCYRDSNNFYRLLIDASGRYMVSSKIMGTYSDIISRTTASTLNTGLGVENMISVTQESLSNFSVSFNGTQETLFSDPTFTGGKAGFYASVGSPSEENFPDIPEDIRFKMSSPTAYP